MRNTKNQTNNDDLWPNREEYKRLAMTERTRLAMTDPSYWEWFSVSLGGGWTDRTCRAYAFDPIQYPSTSFVVAAAKHFGVPAERLHCPSARERREAKNARWRQSTGPAVPEPPPTPAKKSLVIDGNIMDLVDRLRKLDEPGLAFIRKLLDPYWAHLAAKK